MDDDSQALQAAGGRAVPGAVSPTPATPVEAQNPAAFQTPGNADGAAPLDAAAASPSTLMPALLLGTYTPKIDAKGRVALPAKFRAQLGAGCVLARGQERCVYLLPIPEFRRIAGQVQRTSLSDKRARNYLRVFLSGAVDEVPDKQGRVTVPPMLREYAGLGGEIVVIGVGTRAEVWDKSTWETYLAQQEDDYSDMADDILPAGGL